MAFQFRDDLIDEGDGAVPGAAAAVVNRMIDEARSAVRDPAIPEEAAEALGSLALALALPEG
jgi:hypothetical protein